MIEDRHQKSKDRRHMTEDRYQKTKDRRHMTDDMRQMTEGRFSIDGLSGHISG